MIVLSLEFVPIREHFSESRFLPKQIFENSRSSSPSPSNDTKKNLKNKKPFLAIIYFYNLITLFIFEIIIYSTTIQSGLLCWSVHSKKLIWVCVKSFNFFLWNSTEHNFQPTKFCRFLDDFQKNKIVHWHFMQLFSHSVSASWTISVTLCVC